MDITKEWTSSKGTPGTLSKMNLYTVDGVTYQVDGKHILFRPTRRERAVARILSKKYGKRVAFVPQIVYPQGIQTPDYLINGERFDLKSPKGQGKNVLYSMVYKKKKQAPNFIFDITDYLLSEEEIDEQIQGLFASEHTQFIEKIVVLKHDEIIKVYKKE